MPLDHIGLIGVPSSAGGRQTGQDLAPAALRAAHLLERLRAADLRVTDLGDLDPVRYRPDSERPRLQNLDSVVDVAQRASERVDRALAMGCAPLVVGGDCSLSLGVIAGLLRRQPRLGLLYFDADLDLNTPDTTPSGILDGMVLAHALGRGAEALAGIGPRVPMLSEADVVVFGYDVGSGSIDPYEVEQLEASQLSRYPLARVREDPEAVAHDALRELEARCDAVLVHFDVDVTDLPAVDVPHIEGLDVAAAFSALRVFASSPACAALVVTEFNAELDPDGRCAETLVSGLVQALGPRLA